MWFPVYARRKCPWGTLQLFRSVLNLLHNCNTRYGWSVRPYPTGISTLQEKAKLLGAQRLRAQQRSPRHADNFAHPTLRANLFIGPPSTPDCSEGLARVGFIRKSKRKTDHHITLEWKLENLLCVFTNIYFRKDWASA
jgi:hypothetical protein